MKNLLLIALLLLSIENTYGQIRQSTDPNAPPKEDSPEERFKDELEKTMDPKTGKVPFDELEKARSLMTQVISTMAPIPGVEWKERGPNNIGGRVRALMFDPNDATKKKVWAGGVAGGLWYNNDITTAGTSWNKIFDFWDNMAISCIAYDPSNTNIFYVGTGEGYSNVDAVQGGGIWKTTDGGITWKRLVNTIPSFTATSGQTYAFRSVQKIVVNSSGRIFAATRAGVWTSNDGGTVWTLATGLPSGGVDGSSLSLPSSFVSDLEIGSDNVVYAAFGYYYYPTLSPVAGTPSAIYKTNNVANDGTSWLTITPSGVNGSRTEIALAPSTSGITQTIYMINQQISDGRAINFTMRSSDAGTNWVSITKPTGGSTSPDITNGQAWYDLIIVVHPTNPDLVFVGGATHARSINGTITPGTSVSWNVSTYKAEIHPDNHMLVYRPNNLNEVVIGNDGGIYYSANFGNSAVSPTYSSRNTNFNITQYYSGAQKNVANDGYIMAAAQDNGAQFINSAVGVIGAGGTVQSCCDGMNTFIDQNEPTIQIHSTQFNWYRLFNEATSANIEIINAARQERGSFVNPSDYDSQNNILYTYEGLSGANLFVTYVSRTVITASPLAGTYNFFSFAGNERVTFIKVAQAANTLFYGTNTGKVYRLSGIPTSGSAPAPTLIFTGPAAATVSSIDVGATDAELIVTFSNYNVKSVYYTNNASAVSPTWVSKDESNYGLPNIPVRSVLFNPLNRQQVLIATELGVWSTTNILAANPEWSPTNAKLAHVKCNTLRYRAADSQVLVATHGRGVFTTTLNQLNPCQTVMMLVAPYDNKTSGTSTFDKTETISATNQISGTAKVTYKASKSIELKPTNPTDGSTGFKVDAGAVFQAYITGCNN